MSLDSEGKREVMARGSSRAERNGTVRSRREPVAATVLRVRLMRGHRRRKVPRREAEVSISG